MSDKKHQESVSAAAAIVALAARDGGPVHPVTLSLPDGGQHIATGMTLRDWFAGQVAAEALQIALGFNCKEASPCPSAARLAYEMADAMLVARAARLPSLSEKGGENVG